MCIEPSVSAGQRGLTLIELIVFIVIVSVGIAGILAVMNMTVKSSADPMLRKQAMALAESILDEVLAKDYCDPDLTPPACTVSRESSRSLYDDVQDYDGQSIQGTDTLGATSIADLAGYVANITVADTTVGVITMKKITVKVTGGIEPVELYGYRANY